MWNYWKADLQNKKAEDTWTQLKMRGWVKGSAKNTATEQMNTFELTEWMSVMWWFYVFFLDCLFKAGVQDF